MNMVLADCKELNSVRGAQTVVSTHAEMLLNGAHICMMVPGENKVLAGL